MRLRTPLLEIHCLTLFSILYPVRHGPTRGLSKQSSVLKLSTSSHGPPLFPSHPYKGLSNKKVGATSINSKSSRSHIVLTCVQDFARTTVGIIGCCFRRYCWTYGEGLCF